jgi:O-antigen/teichoic acid export membrane protein
MKPETYSVHRFRKALWQFGGGRLAQAAARVVLVLALVRILPVHDYGAYMLIFGTAELMLQLGSFGILPLMQRYLPQMLTTLPLARLYRFVASLITAQAVALGLIAFVVWSFWDTLAPTFGMDPAQTEATRFAAWLFVIIPVFRFSTELLESMLGQGQTARALMVFLRAAAIIVLVAVKDEVLLTDVLLVDAIVTGLCIVVAWYSVRRMLASLHEAGASGAMPVREMVRFAWHMALVGPMSATASPGAVRLVLANSLGLAETALFSFLQSIERLVKRYLPATLLRNLIRPMLISRYLGQGNTDIMKAGTGLLLKSNMIAVVGGVVVIAVCGDQIVSVLSGHKFARGAGITLLLLYLNMVVTSQRGVQEMVMQITGHTKQLWVTSAVYPLALVMIWLLADYGLNVAVLVVTAGSILANSLAASVLQNKTDWYRVDWRGMTVMMLAGLAASGLGILLVEAIPPFAAGAIAFVLFIAFLRVGRPFTTGEIRIVERVVGARAVRLLKGFAA